MQQYYTVMVLLALVFASACATTNDPTPEQIRVEFERIFDGPPPTFAEPDLARWRTRFLQDRQRFESDKSAFFSPQRQTRCRAPADLIQQVRQELETAKADEELSSYRNLQVQLIEGKCPRGRVDGEGRWRISYQGREFDKEDKVYRKLIVTEIDEGTFRNGTLVSTDVAYQRKVKAAVGPKAIEPQDAPLSYYFWYGISKPDNPREIKRGLTFWFSHSSANSYAFMYTILHQALSGGGTKKTMWRAQRPWVELSKNADDQLHGMSASYESGNRVEVCFQNGEQADESRCQ